MLRIKISLPFFFLHKIAKNQVFKFAKVADKYVCQQLLYICIFLHIEISFTYFFVRFLHLIDCNVERKAVVNITTVWHLLGSPQLKAIHIKRKGPLSTICVCFFFCWTFFSISGHFEGLEAQAGIVNFLVWLMSVEVRKYHTLSHVLQHSLQSRLSNSKKYF